MIDLKEFITKNGNYISVETFLFWGASDVSLFQPKQNISLN